jgi:uncharacterized protein YbaA (DUF1428 family)
VKVSITRGGGVAGLLRVVEVEADDVPAGAVAALRAAASPGRPLPDEMTYAVRAGDAEAVFTDSTLPEEVRRLIAWADAHPARREQIRPPG